MISDEIKPGTLVEILPESVMANAWKGMIGVITSARYDEFDKCSIIRIVGIGLYNNISHRRIFVERNCLKVI